MKKIKAKRKKSVTIDKFVFRSMLKSSTTETLAGLNMLKNDTLTTDLFDKYRELVNKEILEKTISINYKKNINDLYSGDGILRLSSAANEIIWCISTCLVYKSELKDYLKLSEDIESYVVSNNPIKFSESLQEIEMKFGWSVWLLENRIAATQHWHGPEAKKEIVKEMREHVKENILLDLIINFIGKRVEDSSIPGYLQTELAKSFKNSDSKLIHEYARAKIFDRHSLNFEQISILLCLDYNANLIDYYESLINVLRWSVSNEQVFRQLEKSIRKPIKVLYNALQDPRLIPILICLGEYFDTPINYERESILEKYTAGRYLETINLVENYFKDSKNITDISILFIGIKSESKVNLEIEYPFLLSEISDDIKEVLKFNENSYASALTLNVYNDRFMNHSWSTHIRFAVMNELSVQNYSMTIDYLRDLFLIDNRISPFTLLLSTNPSYTNECINALFKNHYENTKEVLRLATLGKVKSNYQIEQISRDRYLKYLGRYYQHNNFHDKALVTLEEALKYSESSESLKIHAAIIISLARSGNIELAITKLIDTYLVWHAVPTKLPFDELIDLLDDPDQWPASISLPLILALYTNFFGNSKLAHLRYSFEKYNIENSVNTPFDLISGSGNVNKEYIKLYLQLVWRPEVMGQTLIYNGTKEIEEARIQVCKALIEIDPNNSSDYQMEIRERVKQLELAKATKLVDQSRVYVDVGAIKKSLKSRLGDVYSKYITTMQYDESDNIGIVNVLTDVFGNFESTGTSLTKLMSTVHILGEEDTQFAALFSEITTEFLLGDHGLNTYLSTRVRHGKFSNAIRKPLVDEILITEKSEGTGKYNKNVYWYENLLELDEGEKNNVLQLLEVFGKKIDDIISYVRDELIQVQVVDDISVRGGGVALFSYRTTNVERIYVKSKLQELDNIDEFIDICIDILWEKTDDNLVKVKNSMQTIVKSSILTAFEKLNESLGTLGYSERLGELPNHIARAKTNIQHQISIVSTWFTRNEVYDRPDYSIDFPVLIAQTMVTNLISGAENWGGVNINLISNASQMPGRTLDGMVDLYCACFENAIEHSGLAISDIKIDVELNYQNGIFELAIRNNIDNYTLELEERITQIRTEISKKDTRVKAQKEKGSGFHKIWSTINSPHYKDPKLTFTYKGRSQFEVTVQYKIEVLDEQYTYN
ncbi:MULTISPECIES: hypothetical protein [unclassified Enterobacter]|uniref:hypothetical protein n=1 Tax=unclassified Enterobacter TaxID=2608935 RepID=UPI003B43BB61